MNDVRKSIGWADYTWNPVTGCKRGCEYCYARRIHDRFNKTTFSNIVFHSERLLDPLKQKKPSTIFVGSMSDIEYWKKENTYSIIGVCKITPEHTYMFLSKNPSSYLGFGWPKNTMQGLTATKHEDLVDADKINIDMLVKCTPRPFLSIEPLLGMFYYTGMMNNCEKIIVGCDSSKGASPPKKEWIQSVIDSVPNDRIYWKNNIKKYLP